MSQVPDSFVCPITLKLMLDPHLCVGDGITYEKSAIVDWFSQSDISPMNGLQLNDRTLIKNLAVKNAIDEWLNNNVRNKMDISDNSIDHKVDNAVVVNSIDNAVENKVDYKLGWNSNQLLHLSLIPSDMKDSKSRQPVLIVAVVDVSGSMNTLTQLAGVDNGFTRLDLVKHALRTIIASLDARDYLAVVSFSSESKTVSLNQMNTDGKLKTLDAIDKLSPDGYTNVWAGLEEGLKNINLPRFASVNKSLLLLTDGQPCGSLTTPEILSKFDLYRATHEKDIKCIVSTAGFGYDLDVELLTSLATRGNGNYLYIPDMSMMGTVFVNYLANTLVTMVQNIKIKVDIHYPKSDQPDTHNYQVSLQYGQHKDLVIEEDKFDTHCHYTVVIDDGHNTARYTIEKNKLNSVSKADTTAEKQRIWYSDRLTVIHQALDRDESNYAETLIDDLYSKCTDEGLKRDLFSDVAEEGQISKAMSVEYYKKWGKYYMPTVIRAHQLQQRNNFKDVGMQRYGGNLFKQLVADIDKLYNELPAPEPSAVSRNSRVIKNMSSLNRYDNGCFDGNGLVEMANGQKKKVKNLKKGDVVKSFKDTTATVVCVTEKEIANYFDVVKLGADKKKQLIITPYHPVRVNNRWQFPCNLGKLEECRDDLDVVYNLVLDQSHTVFINGVECVTLGHDFVGDVVAHPYFGSTKVIEDLMNVDGWEEGRVNLDGYTYIRNADTELIDGMVELLY
jgi:Mg-chelatase subunit ChlD